MDITPEAIINSNSEKVYCSSCRFNGGFYNLFSDWRWCEVKTLNPYYKEEHGASSEFTGKFSSPPGGMYLPMRKIEKNKDGNCKHYQKQWWKFWV